MRRIKDQAGDTIVEVLLAIAVIGMVLGASYATSTRALRTGRDAQEQTEALKVAESQLELVKYMASSGIAPGAPDDVLNGTPGQNQFCVTSNLKKALVGSPAYTSGCANVSGLYSVVVTYTSSSGLFQAAVSWDRVGTSVKGNVQVSARMFR